MISVDRSARYDQMGIHDKIGISVLEEAERIIIAHLL